MKSTLIRYIIIALILTVALASLLLYIGGDHFVLIEPGMKDSPTPAGGYKISMQILIVSGVLITLGIVAIWSFLRMIWDIPARLRSGVSKRKRGQALEAMEDALIAASAGDADKARKKAARARTLIDRPALGRIVSAQAAEVSGDPKEAEAQYRTMLEDEKTRRVAQRGLATLAYGRGDLANAVSYAEQAYGDNKDAKWAFDILFGAQVTDGHWEKALETLDSGEQRKFVSKDIGNRRRAVLTTAQAADLESLGKLDAARELALRGASDDPSFAPGVALAARLLVENGKADRASKLIEKAWGKAPHPALAFAYRDLQSGETSKTRAKRMRGLIKQNSTHRESLLLDIEEALLSGDGVGAWGKLAPLTKQSDPSGRICTLAAKAESLCNNTAEARLWVAKAATAPMEADWSDLDPDGPAFDYTQTDWRRMVFTYGDTGELIHPRHERFEKARPAIDLKGLKLDEDKPAQKTEALPDSSAPKAAVSAPAPSLTSPPPKEKPEPIVKAPSPDVIL